MRTPKAPTHFRLMVSRYVSMVEATRGYHCIGTVTVGFDGHRYLQAALGDDPGLTELIATLSHLSGMSLANTYDATIMMIISLGIFVGYAAVYKLNPTASSRWIGAGAFVFIALAEARVADEYIFQVAPLIAAVPWLLYFALNRKSFPFTSSAVLLAFCCSWCSLVRTGAILICTIFLLATFILRYRFQRPFVPLILLVVACVPSVLFQRALIARRNATLASMDVTASGQNRHPLWHTAYLGLGFIPNSEVHEFRDRLAADKVQSIDPTVVYMSSQYEAILRSEVWRIFKQKPMIVIGNVAAKAGIVTVLGLLLLFPARKVIFAEGEVLWFDIAVLLTAGISAGNAIVAVPRLSYLLTFSCLCVLYSAIKACRHVGL